MIRAGAEEKIRAAVQVVAHVLCWTNPWSIGRGLVLTGNEGKPGQLACAVPRPWKECNRLMPKKVSPKAPSKRKLSRRQQHDLDIEIGFIEGVVQRDPHYVEALQILGDDYTRRGKFENGLRIDEQLARLRPDDPTVLYNLACSYALTGQNALALTTLSRAIENGYDDFKWLLKDPDLKKLRALAAFKTIEAKVRAARLKL